MVVGADSVGVVFYVVHEKGEVVDREFEEAAQVGRGDVVDNAKVDVSMDEDGFVDSIELFENLSFFFTLP